MTARLLVADQHLPGQFDAKPSSSESREASGALILSYSAAGETEVPDVASI